MRHVQIHTMDLGYDWEKEGREVVGREHLSATHKQQRHRDKLQALLITFHFILS